MVQSRTGAMAAGVLLVAFAALAAPYKIDAPDDQKIFFGSPASFQKPAEVDYALIVRSTPEYASIKKNKIQPGTAKYWILSSGASNRALDLIKQVGKETDYDLIAMKGYLGSLPTPIPAEDITKAVLKKLNKK